jgi:uncharacterized integral membrane protein
MKKYLKVFIVVVVLAFLLTFGLKNSQPVRVDYYFDLFAAQMPLYALIYIAAIIGVLIGLTAGLPSRRRLRKAVKQLEEKNADFQTGTTVKDSNAKDNRKPEKT